MYPLAAQVYPSQNAPNISRYAYHRIGPKFVGTYMVVLTAEWFPWLHDLLQCKTTSFLVISSSFPPSGIRKRGGNNKETSYLSRLGHMEKQETEIKQKLEMETGNGNQKLKTEMKMQLLCCYSPS